VKTRLGQCVRSILFLAVVICLGVAAPGKGVAAPYAAFVMDARTGQVLHSRNADTRLHPASLTKMMTLYIVFQAINHGEISLDTVVTISKKAASEPPSKLGLRAGQRIKLRYLIRAAAIKSANDAATALGEAIEGSEAAFARRMNRTAKALGMTRTTFKNANGLTESGHLSTARDMATLGRHLFYDFPEYYNIFSRRSADAGVRRVASTNRKFLAAYRGADGIKTGYTRAAGFNLVASAKRGNVRIIGVIFGGRSTAARNAKMAELLDLGFRRAPGRAPIRKPSRPSYVATTTSTPSTPRAVGKTIRIVTAVRKSPRPRARPNQNPPQELLVAMQNDIRNAVAEAQQNTAQVQEQTTRPAAKPAEATITAVTSVSAPAIDSAVASALATATEPAGTPRPRPAQVVLASIQPEQPIPDEKPVVVTRISTSGGRLWGINIGRYPSRYKAERVLLKTALAEMSTLDGTLRRIVKRKSGYDANFMGMSRETADLACRRLVARNIQCSAFGPS